MSDPDTVIKLRAAFNIAHSEFNRGPSTATKKAYTDASAALNRAIHHAKRNGYIFDTEETRVGQAAPWRNKEPGSMFSHLEPESAAYLDDLREKRNQAARLRYENPNETTQAKLREATNEYTRARRKLDPKFSAKLREYAKKSAEKLLSKS